MNRIELGSFLKQQRNNLGKSLKEMAALVGCSFPYLSDIEAGGIAKPSYDKLVPIAKHYKVKLNLLLEVFYETEEPDREVEQALGKIFEDPAFTAGTRKKAFAEKMGKYTKKLLIELYEKCAGKKSYK